MRLHRELLAILYIFIFLLNDPQFARAYVFQAGAGTSGFITEPGAVIDPLMGKETANIHLEYAMNGGTNSSRNPSELTEAELPVVLEVPSREGYNFAGWYTDSSYTHKITEINRNNAANMVLFAKWTKAIDNRYNVEMYSYKTGSVVSGNQKELKDCVYGFLDDVKIPGMPSTRETDFLNNYISSDGQCLQGLCFTPELILMTSYSEDSKNLGSLLVFDRKDGSYLATLGMKKESHLGGIAFDGENVWICHSNSGSLERISYRYILKIAQDAPRSCVDASGLSDEYRIKNTPSCITSYGGRIWVATHKVLFDSQMVSYSYDSETDTLTSLGSYNIPSKVQGIAFDGGGAVYLSTSYGRNNSSYLKVYSSLLTLTKQPNAPSAKVEMPPCSEEVAVAGGQVYVLFESASRKYFEGTDGHGTSASPIDKLLHVDVASIW